MNWNDGLVEARHRNVSRVFSAQHTYATDFSLQLWHDSILKRILRKFSHKY